ncbi:MAG: MFS transporter, partial [Planctomycetes bacterium]|nr:MFS transporter [Planctomycetota bacterium]
VPTDAIVCCSFGDASASHATALTGINSARYAFRGGRPTPILFVCEDNRIGISVDTPRGWIKERFATMKDMAFFEAEGELDDVWDAAEAAIRHCRAKRMPTFLQLHTTRLWGHAGSDVETVYRTAEELEQAEAQDPLLAFADLLLATGAITREGIVALYEDTDRRLRRAADEAARRPKLTTAEAVDWPLSYRDL